MSLTYMFPCRFCKKIYNTCYFTTHPASASDAYRLRQNGITWFCSSQPNKSFRVHKRLSALSVLSAQVPECYKCSSAWCLSVLGARVPFECPPSAQVSKCPMSVQVTSECPSAWVYSKSHPSALRNFKLALTLTLNEKHSSEMHFKQIIIRF